MIATIRKIIESIDLATHLKQTASQYAAEPQVMRERLLEVIQRDLAAPRGQASERRPRRLETATV